MSDITKTSNEVSPLNDISIESIPVHTMKEDLKNMENPDFKPEEFFNASGVNKIEPQKQTPSPFLSSEKNITINKPAYDEIPQKTLQTAPTPEDSYTRRTINPLKNMSAEETPKEDFETENNLSFKKIFLISGIVFLFIFMAIGGYYFWISQQKKGVAISPEPISEPVSETIEEPKQPVTPAPAAPIFSLDKPNYLVLDIKTTDTAKIKNEIKSRAEKIISSDIKTPVEFIISDANFTPLSFKYFSGIMGIKISEKIISNMEETFSLFIYNDAGKAKLGLLLDAKDEKIAKNQLTQDESLLINQLNPLFLDIPYTVKDAKFNDGQYNSLAIRFNNLISDSNLSLDYTFYGKKLIIGTSKMTLRSVYDYAKSIPSKTSPENNTPVITE